ncbi:unnamed protein product [Lupinus luteus]|uniref:Uncharacterized protein n=1 Tax=Lupinus luteus TaxID=3873 RepID=A0AAV1WGG5_LUPLU
MVEWKEKNGAYNESVKVDKISGHYSLPLQILATAILLSYSSAIILSSSSSSARTEGRRNRYKVAVDAEEGRRCRRSVAKASQLNNSSPLLLTTSIESLGFDRLQLYQFKTPLITNHTKNKIYDSFTLQITRQYSPTLGVLANGL